MAADQIFGASIQRGQHIHCLVIGDNSPATLDRALAECRAAGIKVLGWECVGKRWLVKTMAPLVVVAR